MSTEIDRDALEQRASDARTRLADTLSALDRRGHEAVKSVEMEVQVLRHAKPVALTAGVAVLAVGVGVVGLVRWSGHRDQKRAAARFGARLDAGLDALGRAWRHPERIALHPPERSVLAQVGRSLLVSLASFAASSLIKYAVGQIQTRALSAPARKQPEALPAVGTPAIVVRRGV